MALLPCYECLTDVCTNSLAKFLNQDIKHTEKSKVNVPRTQKVGAEKDASEPTGSPGTLVPHTHRQPWRLPGIKP